MAVATKARSAQAERNDELHRQWQEARTQLEATGRTRHHSLEGRCNADCTAERCTAHDGQEGCDTEPDRCRHECTLHCPVGSPCRAACRKLRSILTTVVEENTPWALSCAPKPPPGKGPGDVEAAAINAIVLAWRTFDPARGSFSGHLRHYVRGEVAATLHKASRPEASTRHNEKRGAILAEVERRKSAGEPADDVDAIAAATGASRGVVDAVLREPSLVSLQQPADRDDSDGRELGETIADGHDHQRSAQLEASYAQADEHLAALAADLDAAELAELVLRRLGGMKSVDVITLLGVTRGQAQRWPKKLEAAAGRGWDHTLTHHD